LLGCPKPILVSEHLLDTGRMAERSRLAQPDRTVSDQASESINDEA